MRAPASANRATICRRSTMGFLRPGYAIDVARADYRGRLVALSIEADIEAERSWMPSNVGLPPQICSAKPPSLTLFRRFPHTKASLAPVLEAIPANKACLCGENRRRSGCRVGLDGRTIQ